MRYTRLFHTVAIGVLVGVFAAATLVPSAAQRLPRPPQSQPPTQQKNDQSKKPDQRQTPPAQPQDPAGDVIKIDTELVQLDVMVIDQANNPIFNLRKEDFTVYEDKVKQVIESVSREEVPLSFGLVVDTSGSMRSKLQTVIDSALGLIKQMRPDDEGFVVQFKAEPELVQDYTSDKRELEESLGELYTSGGTAMLDALIAASDYAHEKGKNRRKAMIVISDGVEKNSSVKEKEVMQAVKENEVQLYLIGFTDEGDGGIFSKSAGKKAKELLERLAEDSGGRAFFPRDVSEIAAIAAQISQDLRMQYAVSYYPSNEKKDGSFRTVQVVINPRDNRKLIARTRRGYYARPDSPAQTFSERKR
jgi:Ca-activated chloride channel homolog